MPRSQAVRPLGMVSGNSPIPVWKNATRHYAEQNGVSVDGALWHSLGVPGERLALDSSKTIAW